MFKGGSRLVRAVCAEGDDVSFADGSLSHTVNDFCKLLLDYDAQSSIPGKTNLDRYL